MAFENPIVGGEHGELIRESIKSPDYLPGVRGWIIKRDGTAEFINLNIVIDSTTGSISVGPVGGPQVIIRISNGDGLIQFDTNGPNQSTLPAISGEAQNDMLWLDQISGLTSGSSAVSEMHLGSGDDATAKPARAWIGAYSSTGYSEVFMIDTYMYLDTPELRVDREVLVSYNQPDVNEPVRVVSGRVNSGTNTVTLTAADAEITNTAATSAYLVNGTAYTVDVQIQTRQSVGTSAAGTQRFDWKLWETAVGGTQLDATIETWNGSVGNNLDTVQFSFIFNYAGTTGSKTLRLSCADGAGADTLQVQSNTKFFMLVKRVGLASKILNL